jgi:hypothetical protein
LGDEADPDGAAGSGWPEEDGAKLRIKKGIDDTMQVVLSVRGIIDSAIQAVPQTALAWTGVCLALQVWSQRRRVAHADFPRSS